MLNNIISKLIKTTLPKTFSNTISSNLTFQSTISANSSPYLPSNIQQSKPNLTHHISFHFSSFSKPPNTVAAIHLLQKQVKQAKTKSGETSPQHLEYLHQLSLALNQHQYHDQAIQTAQKFVQLFELAYSKQPQTTPIQELNRIINLRYLHTLYKINLKYEKYFEFSRVLIPIHLNLIQNQLHFTDFLIDLQIQVATTHFQLHNFQEALPLLQNALLHIKKIPTDQHNLIKQLETKNMIGYILFENNHIQEAFTILSENLTEIAQPSNQNLNPKIISECLVTLTAVYTKKLPTLTNQQCETYLNTVNPFVKSVENCHKKNQITPQNMLHFYQNVAQICFHAKDYNKAIQLFRLEREQIPQNDFDCLASCYENQAKLYEAIKKIEKAIQKLTKAIEARQKIHALYANKKRKTSEQQKMVNEGKKLMLEASIKIVQLYKKAKNDKKAQLWSLRTEQIGNL